MFQGHRPHRVAQPRDHQTGNRVRPDCEIRRLGQTRGRETVAVSRQTSRRAEEKLSCYYDPQTNFIIHHNAFADFFDNSFCR